MSAPLSERRLREHVLEHGDYLKVGTSEACPSGVWLLVPLPWTVVEMLEQFGAGHEDIEDGADGEGDSADDEPSHGSLDRALDQTVAWTGDHANLGEWETDREYDDGDTEPDIIPDHDVDFSGRGANVTKGVAGDSIMSAADPNDGVKAKRADEGELQMAIHALHGVLEALDWIDSVDIRVSEDRPSGGKNRSPHRWQTHHRGSSPAVLVSQPRRAVLEALEAAGVPYAPVNDIGELARTPQFAASELLQRLPDGDPKVVGLPITVDRDRPRPARSAPKLGEHTDEVLGTLQA
jgi:hypothetical protein